MTGRRTAFVLVLIAALAAAVYLVPGLDPVDEKREPGAGSDAPTYGCRDALYEPGEDVRAAERATLCLLNAERRRKGLRPLRPNRTLRLAALRHSRDMVKREFFDHVNPDGDDAHERILKAGYKRPTAGGLATGENLGTGEREASTPAAIVEGWMNSRGHRRNILRRTFIDVGIGIVPEYEGGGRGGTYTTTFGGTVEEKG